MYWRFVHYRSLKRIYRGDNRSFLHLSLDYGLYKYLDKYKPSIYNHTTYLLPSPLATQPKMVFGLADDWPRLRSVISDTAQPCFYVVSPHVFHSVFPKTFSPEVSHSGFLITLESFILNTGPNHLKSLLVITAILSFPQLTVHRRDRSCIS